MRIELRKSGGDTCKECGSHELLYVPALAEHLERDLVEFFRQDIPWYQPIKRRRFEHFAKEVEQVASDLRDATRHQIA